MVRSAVAALAVFLSLPSFAFAQSAESLPALQKRILQDQARREAAEIETARYAEANTARPKPTPAAVLKGIIDELERQATAAKLNTQGTPEAAQSRFEASLQRRAAFQQDVENRQAAEGFDWATRATAPVQFELADAIILGSALFLVLASWMLSSNKSRVAIRRAHRFRGMASLITVGALLTSAGCEAPVTPTNVWGEKRKTELEEELKAATSKMEEARATAKEQRTAFFPPSIGTDAIDNAAEKYVTAKVFERMAQIAEDERIKLDAETAVLAQLRSANRWNIRGMLALRIGGAVLLVGLAMWPYFRSRRKRLRQRKIETNTCPRCLAVDKFREVITGTRDDRYTETSVLECRSCEYRFRKVLQEEARLCFPTVGIRSSGKTHMLATAYATVKAGKAKTTARMQVAPSLGDDRFNVYIELILKQRGTAGATVHGQRAEDMPYPIILNVGDADRAGSQNVLVNLFDYSGEMMTETLDVGLLRRRAVLMDGFLLFFDPTQMYGDMQDGEATLSIEDQLKALGEFSHDLRGGRKLPFGPRVDVPVAVCLSKFDMVATHSPMGGQALPFLDHLRTTLNPPGPVNLALLKARSETVEQMLPFMLPGVDLAKILRDSFGEHFLFFPTSDRGFAASNPTKSQSGLRPTPVPYGVLDPVLWLLHMHGYQTLDDKASPPATEPKKSGYRKR